MMMLPDKLIEMLSVRRPHGSEAEAEWIEKYILGPLHGHNIKQDGMGNILVSVSKSPNVLFSAHTDTAAWHPGDQKVLIDEYGIAIADPGPIGGDCTVGCWVLLEMIGAGIPGLYVFHRGEEKGCIGSEYIASRKPWVVSGIDQAIAFDRKGVDSVITHQMGERCCSRAYALALSMQLGGDYLPDPTGSYTDTACYISLVPEVTNISIGYNGEHLTTETVDLHHAVAIRDAAIAVDWQSLPIERDPNEAIFEWEEVDEFLPHWADLQLGDLY